MFILRPMHLNDLAQVMVVNHRCFSYGWSERVFRLELAENPHSHWVVMERMPDNAIATPPSRNPFRALFRRAERKQQTIIGFGGFWLLTGEAHISNIGIDPDFRGQNLGELLLLTMLKRAIQIGADWTSLEVRVSNQPAINLYEKYGYSVAARRASYYRDNHEDAFWMTVKPMDATYLKKLNKFSKQLALGLEWKDKFTGD